MYYVKRFTSHTVLALLEAGLVALLVVGLIAGTALAAKGQGKPSGGGGGSLELILVNSADGVANYGETITFKVTTSATRPFVSVNCYQGGAWVYAASVGFFPDYPWAKTFVLAANSWPGGAATCTARLYTTKDGIRTTTLTTMGFDVAP